MADTSETDAPIVPHKWYEDVQALVLGTLLLSFGVIMYSEAMLITGGVDRTAALRAALGQ